MVFRFPSDQAAVDFVEFMENDYELVVDIESYLHIEVPDEEFSDIDDLETLYGHVEVFGGQEV